MRTTRLHMYFDREKSECEGKGDEIMNLVVQNNILIYIKYYTTTTYLRIFESRVIKGDRFIGVLENE